MTREGKIILEAAGRVAMAPDGNGGIYPALQRTGALADMRGRGVEHVHVFSIDNALVRVADPHFLGYCVEKKADCGNKSVWKAEPGEKVRCATRPSLVREKDGHLPPAVHTVAPQATAAAHRFRELVFSLIVQYITPQATAVAH